MEHAPVAGASADNMPVVSRFCPLNTAPLIATAVLRGFLFSAMLKQYDKAAEFMVVGFKRGWLLKEVAAAIGVDPYDDDQRAEMAKACPFMPAEYWHYKRPVRAFVAVEWPRMSDFMLKHEDAPQKLLSVLPALKKSAALGVKHGTKRSKADLAEMRATRRDYRANAISYAASRESFKSNQRSAWGVCKA